MINNKSFVAVLAACAALTGLADSAWAQVPACPPGYYYAPSPSPACYPVPPAYAAPPPAYAVPPGYPPPAYGYPPPVVYAAPPVVYADPYYAPPVVFGLGFGFGGGHRR